MFVKSNRFRRNPKTILFTIRVRLRCTISKGFVTPLLKWFDTPKGELAYKLFQMSNKKSIVTEGTVCIQVTPAQQKLLQLISHTEAEDYFNSLKSVHYLGTYCVNKDMVELWQNGYVHNLLDVIQEIKQEHFITNLKTA
jgi:hypothetical protein